MCSRCRTITRAPAVPTLSMTFTKYGLQDFVVEYWTGAAWEACVGRDRGEQHARLATVQLRTTDDVTHSGVGYQGVGVAQPSDRNRSVRGGGRSKLVAERDVTGPAAGSTFRGIDSAYAPKATATDGDGTVSHVNFYVNGTLVGTDTEGVAGAFTTTWTSALAGSFSVTAVATDDDGATRTSTPVEIAFTPPSGRVNVALAANGGTAVASSTDGSGFPASGVINGDRRGLNWGAGGGWQDGTAGVWPDWLEVQFNGPTTDRTDRSVLCAGQLRRAHRAHAEHDVHEVRVAGLRRGVLDGKHMAGGTGRKRVEQHQGLARVPLRSRYDVAHSRVGDEGARVAEPVDRGRSICGVGLGQ